MLKLQVLLCFCLQDLEDSEKFRNFASTSDDNDFCYE